MGRAHRAGGEHAGGDLIKQRPEGMGITLIDKRHVVAAAAQLACDEQTAKTAIDDYDMMACAVLLCGRFLAPNQRLRRLVASPAWVMRPYRRPRENALCA
ncbi:hypothetical protein T35B1_08829 [Salinisphaera shabanensis T35B1]